MNLSDIEMKWMEEPGHTEKIQEWYKPKRFGTQKTPRNRNQRLPLVDTSGQRSLKAKQRKLKAQPSTTFGYWVVNAAVERAQTTRILAAYIIAALS